MIPSTHPGNDQVDRNNLAEFNMISEKLSVTLFF